MKPIKLKVARVGNSRGVRLPAATLDRYQIGEELIMEERSDGILLRPPASTGAKLSWAETATAMAASSAEDWSEWDAVTADGISRVPWDAKKARRVAERPGTYSPKPKRAR